MNAKYADIIVDISHSSLDRIFQYRIPIQLLDSITIGQVVNIPFGNGNKVILGYVIEISNNPNILESKIKDILSIASSNVSIESHLISLAVWMKGRYNSTLQSALKTLIPVNSKVNKKMVNIVNLTISLETLSDYREVWINKKYNALVRASEYLLQHVKCKQSDFMRYAQVPNSTIVNMQKKGIITISSKEEFRNPYTIENIKKRNEYLPNESQQICIDTICDSLDNKKSDIFLLHGITGSGKTEVYMQVIKKVLEKGQQAIVLIPEISLTPQTVRRFMARFREQVGVMHSKLSQGEKYDQWRKAKEGHISIMIGPRSAIFTPFNNLGIIIIDEEHEMTYKSETSPKYHAKEVAIKRGHMTGAKIILGSATPSIESYNMAKNDRYQLLELKEKAKSLNPLQVEIVDMREELANGNTSILSVKLRDEIKSKLEKKEQIILFLNRRGHSRFVSCRQCGYVVKCNSCDIPCTYHSINNKLLCHYCGHSINMVSKCPSCSSKYIKQFGVGTQQVEEYIKKEFEGVRILRMDFDTTSKKNSYDKLLSSFAKHEVDILIGTQMIAKGHDFEKVTLVGVLAADLSLYTSDFRASERTFQLLTQVTGRAGRSSLLGSAIIQSYTPDHYSIIRAKEQNYIDFFREEIIYRKLMMYSPFSSILVLLLQASDEKNLIKKSYDLAEYIEKIKGEEIELIGPAPANVSKIKNKYRRKIILKSKEYNILNQFAKHLSTTIHRDNHFNDISIQMDINPLVSI